MRELIEVSSDEELMTYLFEIGTDSDSFDLINVLDDNNNPIPLKRLEWICSLSESVGRIPILYITKSPSYYSIAYCNKTSLTLYFSTNLLEH